MIYALTLLYNTVDSQRLTTNFTAAKMSAQALQEDQLIELLLQLKVG